MHALRIAIIIAWIVSLTAGARGGRRSAVLA